MRVRGLAPIIALVVLLAVGCSPEPQSLRAADASVPAKPNFVFILADDMRKDDLKYMPKTRSLLGNNGMRFRNAYVSLPLCCPSRSTIMRGQYSHNTGVLVNSQWEGYKANGNEQDNVATRLDAAGYRTGLFGKYLNGYDGSVVPPGWDSWFAKLRHRYYDYNVNVNGRMKHFGTRESDYATDVIGERTREFIGASAGKPFFAYVAPTAPHGPYDRVPRHSRDFDGERAPRPPSFNERNVRDKPAHVRALPRFDDAQIAEIDTRHENRAEALQALDDLVEGVVDKLRAEGALRETYIVFTSDNGWGAGEHRIQGKGRAYQESVRAPLLVRGPGVETGAKTDKLALNSDYLPTFTDLAGIRTPEYVDGRSLRPVLEGSASNATWRNAVLLEQHYRAGTGKNSDLAFSGVLTSSGKKYVEYDSGERELYDLRADPYELENLAGQRPEEEAALKARLEALKDCAGNACRITENAP